MPSTLARSQSSAKGNKADGVRSGRKLFALAQLQPRCQYWPWTSTPRHADDPGKCRGGRAKYTGPVPHLLVQFRRQLDLSSPTRLPMDPRSVVYLAPGLFLVRPPPLCRCGHPFYLPYAALYTKINYIGFRSDHLLNSLVVGYRREALHLWRFRPAME